MLYIYIVFRHLNCFSFTHGQFVAATECHGKFKLSPQKLHYMVYTIFPTHSKAPKHRSANKYSSSTQCNTLKTNKNDCDQHQRRDFEFSILPNLKDICSSGYSSIYVHFDTTSFNSRNYGRQHLYHTFVVGINQSNEYNTA